MAISIIATIVVVIGFSITAYIDARAALLNNMKATYLVEEGYEIIRALRDDDWNTLDALVIDDVYYFDVSTTTVAFATTGEVIDGEFYRSFILADVYRDNNDDITASTTLGATIDPDSVEVMISVFGPNGTTTMTAILANIHAV